MVRKDSAQVRLAQGIGRSNTRQTQRRPSALTEKLATQEGGVAVDILGGDCLPHRRSSVSSKPMISGPSGANVSMSSRSSTRLTARLSTLW